MLSSVLVLRTSISKLMFCLFSSVNYPVFYPLDLKEHRAIGIAFIDIHPLVTMLVKEGEIGFIVAQFFTGHIARVGYPGAMCRHVMPAFWARIVFHLVLLLLKGSMCPFTACPHTSLLAHTRRFSSQMV